MPRNWNPDPGGPSKYQPSKEEARTRREQILKLRERGLTARQISTSLSPSVTYWAVRNLIARMRKQGLL